MQSLIPRNSYNPAFFRVELSQNTSEFKIFLVDQRNLLQNELEINVLYDKFENEKIKDNFAHYRAPISYEDKRSATPYGKTINYYQKYIESR